MSSTALSPLKGSNSPSTPTTPATASKTTETPSPGSWRHPKWAEITERQKKHVFDHTNLRTIVLCVVLFIASFPIKRWISWSSIAISLSIPTWLTWLPYPLLMRLYLVYKTTIALRPFWLKPDNFPDIDLSAAQRKLLGLDPNATPPTTASTKYTTPPRYARAAAPRSGGTPGSNSSLGTSIPSGGSGKSTGSTGTPSRSPYLRQANDSARGGSPLRRSLSAVSRTKDRVDDMVAESAAAGLLQGRNASPGKWATPAGGGGNDWGSSGSLFAPNTPSPVGRQASVPLNSRWLFEKGRRSSSGSFGAGLREL